MRKIIGVFPFDVKSHILDSKVNVEDESINNAETLREGYCAGG